MLVSQVSSLSQFFWPQTFQGALLSVCLSAIVDLAACLVIAVTVSQCEGFESIEFRKSKISIAHGNRSLLFHIDILDLLSDCRLLIWNLVHSLNPSWIKGISKMNDEASKPSISH